MARKVDWKRWAWWIALPFLVALGWWMGGLMQLAPTKPPAVKTAPVKKGLTDHEMIRSLYTEMIQRRADEKRFRDGVDNWRLPAVRATGGKR